jgi:hypothetical protein
MPKTYTPKEIAAQFGTDPKNLRKFLRKDAKDKGVENPGKGQRWSIEANKVKALKKGFDAWMLAKATNEDKGDNLPDAPEGDDEVFDPETAPDA